MKTVNQYFRTNKTLAKAINFKNNFYYVIQMILFHAKNKNTILYNLKNALKSLIATTSHNILKLFFFNNVLMFFYKIYKSILNHLKSAIFLKTYLPYQILLVNEGDKEFKVILNFSQNFNKLNEKVIITFEENF